MTCVLELKLPVHNNEDLLKKNNHFKYWNSLYSNHMEKKDNRVSVLTIRVLKVINFFSWIFIIMYRKLKFQSAGHLKPSKYLY